MRRYRIVTICLRSRRVSSCIFPVPCAKALTESGDLSLAEACCGPTLGANSFSNYSHKSAFPFGGRERYKSRCGPMQIAAARARALASIGAPINQDRLQTRHGPFPRYQIDRVAAICSGELRRSCSSLKRINFVWQVIDTFTEKSMWNWGSISRPASEPLSAPALGIICEQYYLGQ